MIKYHRLQSQRPSVDQQYPSISRTMQYKKYTKPLLERKRRARFNRCLDELKDLMVGALEAEGENINKLEKADILELTVRHLQRITKPTDPVQDAHRFQAGFSHCASEACTFLLSLPGLDNIVGRRLVDHLRTCITAPIVPCSRSRNVEIDENLSNVSITRSVNLTTNDAPYSVQPFHSSSIASSELQTSSSTTTSNLRSSFLISSPEPRSSSAIASPELQAPSSIVSPQLQDSRIQNLSSSVSENSPLRIIMSLPTMHQNSPMGFPLNLHQNNLVTEYTLPNESNERYCLNDPAFLRNRNPSVEIKFRRCDSEHSKPMWRPW